MPFMIKPSPIRRTTRYLEAGKIVFRETVKIFSLHFNTDGDHHEGARDFFYWHLPQVQYKNPNVQCVVFQNLTPSPFIKIYFEDAKSVLIDVDTRNNDEIVDHLANFTAVCKTQEELTESKKGTKPNFTYFGFGCERHCICEVLGQIPCPSLVLLPTSWRGRGEPVVKKNYRIPLAYMEPELEDKDKNGD